MESIKSNSDDVTWLKQKLKYANEASLRKRLKVIFSELLKDFPSIIKFLCLNDKKKFNILVDRIVKTRNFYVHYDLSSDDIIYNDDEAYTVSVIMVEILRIILLKSCHVPIDVIDNFAQNNQTLLYACSKMGFITLIPAMITKMLMPINDNIFWFRSSYFSDDLTVHDSVVRLLDENEITCFITVDDYEKMGWCYYNENKTIKRHLFKIDTEHLLEKGLNPLYEIFDKNIKLGNKIAIWLSDDYINRGIIDNIKARYSSSVE